ncbi:MAG: acetylornithine deacetylase [Rhizobiaceae bacterium]
MKRAIQATDKMEMQTSTTLQLLERLVAFPTVSRESNLAIIDFIEAFLLERGATVHRIKDPVQEKAGLFARIGPSDGEGILLSGHTDVVPVAGQDWSGDPFALRRDGSRVYGRGTTDMKGFLAAMLAAADRASRQKLAQPLKFAFSWDEELGCLGIPKMLPELDASIGRPQLCIVGEPTLMRVALGHKGKVALRAVCNGMAGHSAMAPDFVNAIHLAVDFIGRLRAIQANLQESGVRDTDYAIPYTTVHVGKISGGTALNIVADHAVVDFEFRYPANEDPQRIRAAIGEAAELAARPYRERFAQARIELEEAFAYPGLGTARNSQACDLMLGFVDDRSTLKVAYGTEGGCFCEQGIPSLVCGPGSMDQGHQSDEFIEISQLAACDTMLDRVITHLSR